MPATSGMKAVALFLVWLSIAQLDFRIPIEPPRTAYNAVVLTTAFVGFIAAISIWTNARWMIVVYTVWLGLMVVARIWHDILLGAELWQIVCGGVIVAALFGAIGYFTFRDHQAVRSLSAFPTTDGSDS
jgi:hypothetical protein